MRFTIAAALTALAATAQARINGIAVPETIKPGDTFNAIILSSDYIQSVYDVAIAFGYNLGSATPDSLGIIADSYYLGPSESNQLHNFNKTLTIPSSAQKGEGVVSASLMSLYGVGYSPTLEEFNVTVKFGDVTSKKYVYSTA